MRRSFTTGYAAGLALAALIAVAGCTTPDPPPGSSTLAPTTTASSGTSTTSSPPSTTSSTTTAAVDPNIPAAATEKSIGGAEAFVRYVVGRVNSGLIKADPAALDGLYEKTCQTCISWVNQMTDLKVAENHLSGETYAVRSAAASSFETNSAGVLVNGDQVAAQIVNRTGSPVKDVKPAANTNFFFTLAYTTRWKVTLWQKQE